MKNKLITIVLSIMLFVIPLSIMPGGQTYNLPKLYVILISGAILFILMMVNYKQLKLDKKDYIILAFAVMILISTFLSSDLKISIIGARNRYEGMFTFYIYITIYFCAKKFFSIIILFY